MKLLLFDIDGTLLLARGLGLQSMREAVLEIVGAEVPLADVRPDGKTDPHILTELLQGHSRGRDTSLHALVFERYLCLLTDRMAAEPDRLQVLTGVAELVEDLSRRSGLTLAVATGNIEGAARLKLGAAGLDSHLPVGGFGSDDPDRTVVIRTAARRAGLESDIADNDVVVIGDTPSDIRHGRAAGAATVGVATGSYSANQLESAGADLVLDTLAGAADRLLAVGK